MSDNTYKKIIITVLVVCLVLTVLHAAYAIYSYQNCSITNFISKELW